MNIIAAAARVTGRPTVRAIARPSTKPRKCSSLKAVSGGGMVLGTLGPIWSTPTDGGKIFKATDVFEEDMDTVTYSWKNPYIQKLKVTGRPGDTVELVFHPDGTAVVKYTPEVKNEEIQCTSTVKNEEKKCTCEAKKNEKE